MTGTQLSTQSISQMVRSYSPQLQMVRKRKILCARNTVGASLHCRELAGSTSQGSLFKLLHRIPIVNVCPGPGSFAAIATLEMCHLRRIMNLEWRVVVLYHRKKNTYSCTPAQYTLNPSMLATVVGARQSNTSIIHVFDGRLLRIHSISFNDRA